MGRLDRFTSIGTPTSASNPGGNSDVPEGPPPLYPPLNIPEPFISEKKRAVMKSMLKYKHLIQTTRARYVGDNFKPNGLFQVPDFGPPKSKSKKLKNKVRMGKAVMLDKIGDELEKDADTEDEDKPAGTAETKPDDDEDAEAEVKDEDEDEEEVAAKSDSDIDDYTAAAGFDDDEMNFEDAGGDADNDAHTF